ncbi:MAG: methyltransferase domain-containing protein, partial [Alphaproteobacteria bacterium]|nr:methyltransferase domain-containing protein [Alphaproteobacteria bacterium]
MPTPIDRAAYAAATGLRVGWFYGQYMLAGRLSRGSFPAPAGESRGPSQQELLAGLLALFRRDWQAIADGLYRPARLVERPDRAVAAARAYFADLPDVNRRRQARGNAEVFRAPPPGTPKGLPRYYRQNFHYQSGGYLTEQSARLYDHQVEVLFGGGADAMRRRALPFLRAHLKRLGRDARRARLVDVACGTGRFLEEIRANHPALDLTGVDLSGPYLAEARRRFASGGGARLGATRFAQANAEALPMADGSVEAVTCVYLFHELPRKVRATVAAEMARVLKPGGRLIFVDSLQRGETPAYDGALDYFPQGFHEPYYADYIRQDLTALFREVGLVPAGREAAFLSTVAAFDKP